MKTLKWSNLAFGDTSSVSKLNATFIAAPRDISVARFKQLVKRYLPLGNIVVGIANEAYIDGFDGQAQFTTLKLATVEPIITKVNESASAHKIRVLTYNQREITFILKGIAFKRAVFVNGSWLHTFHTGSTFYTLLQKKIPYELVTPFADEAEARAAEIIPTPLQFDALYDAHGMLELAQLAAQSSYDYSFQTGAALGIKQGTAYRALITGFNKVVPYQTYAMHHGASREMYFSPQHDLNHYDTVHAEVELLLEAQKQSVSLVGTTLFINLMPCPSCSRMIADSDIAEIVYQQDHSAGYAITMLEAAGKSVSRLI